MNPMDWLNDIEPDNAGFVGYLKNTLRIIVGISILIIAMLIIKSYLSYLGIHINIDMP